MTLPEQGQNLEPILLEGEANHLAYHLGLAAIRYIALINNLGVSPRSTLHYLPFRGGSMDIIVDLVRWTCGDKAAQERIREIGPEMSSLAVAQVDFFYKESNEN